MKIFTTWAETALGPFFTVVNEEGALVYVHLTPAKSEADFEAWSAKHFPDAEVIPSDEGCAQAAGQLDEWSQGKRRDFDLELDLVGTPFQLECWHELVRIPYGTTLQYGELARRIGKDAGASRAVGGANGANPIPIVVP